MSVLSVPCPKCAALEGELCVRRNGAPRKASHQERWDFAGVRKQWRRDADSPRARVHRRRAMGWIYFAGIEGYRVKIGFTMGSPAKRIADLQTGCPFPISLVGCISGTQRDEKRYHEYFAHLRVSGEWFLVGDELRELLDEIRGDRRP